MRGGRAGQVAVLWGGWDEWAGAEFGFALLAGPGEDDLRSTVVQVVLQGLSKRKLHRGSGSDAAMHWAARHSVGLVVATPYPPCPLPTRHQRTAHWPPANPKSAPVADGLFWAEMCVLGNGDTGAARFGRSQLHPESHQADRVERCCLTGHFWPGTHGCSICVGGASHTDAAREGSPWPIRRVG